MAQRKEEKRNILKPEPAPGPDVSSLRIRLPDGSTHNRRFDAADTVRQIFTGLSGFTQ